MPKQSTHSTTISARSTPYPASTASSSTRTHHYRPSSAWSSAADQLLLHVRSQGLNWLAISARHFPSKTPNACRKRHERLAERCAGEEWDCVKLEALAAAYAEVRGDMWGMLAERVAQVLDEERVDRWQDVEAKVRLSCVVLSIGAES